MFELALSRVSGKQPDHQRSLHQNNGLEWVVDYFLSLIKAPDQNCSVF